MKKTKILKYIEKELKKCQKYLDEEYEALEETRKIPDDPTVGQDIFNDGMINENPHLKTDMLESHQHVIGYWNGKMNTLQEIKYLLTVSKEDYKKDQLEATRIKKENRKQMNSILRKIKEKHGL